MAAGGHQFTYAQRTRDGRIALGGRGAPYHFGSSIRPGYDRDHQVHIRQDEKVGLSTDHAPAV